MIVISDTTPIISFLKIERLDLLKSLYGKIIIPKAVYSELTNNVQFESEAAIIKNCDFIQIEQVKNTQSLDILRKVSGLDLGESEALCLFNEQNANLLLIDEKKGRKVAAQLGIKIIGTVGILIQAFDKKILSSLEVENIIQKLQESDIRLSKSLCDKILKYVKK